MKTRNMLMIFVTVAVTFLVSAGVKAEIGFGPVKNLVCELNGVTNLKQNFEGHNYFKQEESGYVAVGVVRTPSDSSYQPKNSEITFSLSITDVGSGESSYYTESTFEKSSCRHSSCGIYARIKNQDFWFYCRGEREEANHPSQRGFRFP